MNECKIVQDLLPLYAEDLISPETKEFVDGHCESCAHCRKLMERSKMILPDEAADIPNYRKALKRERNYRALVGALFASIVIALALIAFVYVAACVPIKLDKEPIVLESHDGIHSFMGEYYESPFGLNRGLYITEKSRGGSSEGTNEGWI